MPSMLADLYRAQNLDAHPLADDSAGDGDGLASSDMPTPTSSAPIDALNSPAPAQTLAASSAEDAWRAEFRGSAGLQSEFVSEDHFVAYQAALASGRVRFVRATADAHTEMAAKAAANAGPNLYAVRERAKAKFAADAGLQREFGTSEAYANYAEGVMTGRIKLAGRDLKSEL